MPQFEVEYNKNMLQNKNDSNFMLPKITMDTRSILMFFFRNLKNPFKALRKNK